MLLGCTKSKLVLNDVYISGNHMVLSGSAAKGLAAKQVKILIDADERAATTTVDGHSTRRPDHGLWPRRASPWARAIAPRSASCAR